MKKPALIFTGVFTAIAIFMLYITLAKTKPALQSPFVKPQQSTIRTTKIAEFSSKIPKETWEKFNHPKYKYSFSYPPEFSLAEPVAGEEKTLDIVRLFYDKKMAVGVFKAVSEKVGQQEKYEGKDADGNQVITYKFPLGENTLIYQATVYSQFEDKTNFSQIIEQIAETVQIQP